MFDQFKKIDLLSIISSMKKKDISNMMDIYNKNNNQSIEHTMQKNHTNHHKINDNHKKTNHNIKKIATKKKNNQQRKEEVHQDKKHVEINDQKDMKKNITKVVEKKKIKIKKENLHKKIDTFVRAMNNNKIYDQV